VRVKAMTMVMLGGESAGASGRPNRGQTEESPPTNSGNKPPLGIPGLPDVGKALKGLFGG